LEQVCQGVWEFGNFIGPTVSFIGQEKKEEVKKEPGKKKTEKKG